MDQIIQCCIKTAVIPAIQQAMNKMLIQLTILIFNDISAGKFDKITMPPKNKIDDTIITKKVKKTDKNKFLFFT